ncbi:MAG: DUF4384 domain-containing protein [Deinococcales bacterium]
MTKKVLCFLLLAILVSLSYAQNPNQIMTDEKAIIINPAPSFSVDVWIDKRYANGTMASYRIGETIEIGLNSNASAYIYLFNIHADGTVVQIFPNRYEVNNYLSPGHIKYFGVSGSPYQLRIAEPIGEDKLLAIASKTPLDTSVITPFQGPTDFFAIRQYTNETNQQLAQSFATSLSLFPQSSWASDTVIFTIRP